MQSKRERIQQEMTLLPPLETLIPDEHRLRRLNRVIDLRFIHELVRDRYCPDNGRPSIDPEVVMRLFVLQAIEGIRSVRELMREVQVNLAYRWFIGYRLDEQLPDHSTLSKALDRFGDEIFNEVFERSIAQCKVSGLIEGRVLHLDATAIRADIDRDRVGQPDSSDPDARYGKFPGKKMAPGYKQQAVVDGKNRVVVGLSVAPANSPEHHGAPAVIDQAVEHLGQTPEAVCADAAYGNGCTRAAMEQRGIRLVSPPQKPLKPSGGDRFTIDDFVFDRDRDIYVCPAGATLRYQGKDIRYPHKRRYAASQRACRRCALRVRCTQAKRRRIEVSVYRDALLRLHADSCTESFRQLYRTRAPAVEGIFAEAKQWHGLRRAWRRGLAKMRVQCLLIAAVINFKRLIKFFSLWNCGYTVFFRAFRSVWRALFQTALQMPRRGVAT